MTGFTKLFPAILDSTIWRESLSTKVVWITMLAKASRNGIVSASIPGLADAARVTLEECEAALEKFKSPDPYSRTKDFEGRRIMDTDGGWILLNYLKYRKIQDEDAIREATAERVKRFREKHNVTRVTHETPSNAIADAEAEALKEKECRVQAPSAPIPLVTKKQKPPPKVRVTALKEGSFDDFQNAWETVPPTRRVVDKTINDWVNEPIPKGSRFQAEKNFQSIVDSGHATSYELYAAFHAYIQEDAQVKKGFYQHLSTFYGPEKATWIQWMERAKQLVAEVM